MLFAVKFDPINPFVSLHLVPSCLFYVATQPMNNVGVTP